MKCVVNWIPLDTHVRFENTQPCLEEKGKGVHGVYGQSYGNRKGTGSLPMKNICRRQPAYFFLRIASESEKVFARILDESFSCLDLPKKQVVSVDEQFKIS